MVSIGLCNVPMAVRLLSISPDVWLVTSSALPSCIPPLLSGVTTVKSPGWIRPSKIPGSSSMVLCNASSLSEAARSQEK